MQAGTPFPFADVEYASIARYTPVLRALLEQHLVIDLYTSTTTITPYLHCFSISSLSNSSHVLNRLAEHMFMIRDNIGSRDTGNPGQGGQQWGVISFDRTRQINQDSNYFFIPIYYFGYLVCLTVVILGIQNIELF